MTYIGAYLSMAFPRLANLYERVSGQKIPYRRNKLVLASFDERESILPNTRFRFIPISAKELEQRARTN